MFPWKSIGNNDIFFYNSGRAGPVILIFKLDRDIDKAILVCTHFLSTQKVVKCGYGLEFG
jgi:hypothetical protein